MTFKQFQFFFLAAVLLIQTSCADEFEISSETRNFFHLKHDGYYMPVLVRGNTASKKILLFVQGGPASNTMDFADVDYPRWKNTLEKRFAIAYYEPRGMGNRQGNFDLEKISIDQYLSDLHVVARFLKSQYKADVYMLGHSFGGYLTYRYMIKHGDDNVVTKYISANGPATTDNDLTQRWQFRRDFLMNEAKEAIAAGRDVAKWQEILNWCNEHAVFDTDEEFLQWNIYVEENIYIYYEEELPTAKDYLNVAFFSSYNPLTASLNMNAAGIVEEQIEKSEKQFSLVQNLNQLDKPLLILTGRHDDVCPPEEAQYIFDHISSAQKRLKILNDAGHHAFHHQPNEFNAAIEDFINE